jgi:dTDP-4-amino-4,6-dideoxygalactose transaminase
VAKGLETMSATLEANIRTIPVARPCLGPEEEAAVAEVLRSGWITQGPRVAEFELRFAEYVRAEHAVAVSSCTAALHLALLACGVGPGDEVICPSLSFIATANCIVHAGARPEFVDIEPDTYNLDPERIAEAITPRTRAIMVVHQIGLPAALDRILAIAARHGLPVIEDAACAVGSEYFGRRIGAPHGTLACFSFHPRKILTTGEGGMITTRDAELAKRLRRLRQHAMSVSDVARHKAGRVVFESYDEVGYNYRMTDLQAAVGLVQLRRLDDLLARRKYLAARYSEGLSKLEWLAPPAEPDGHKHNFQSYMVRLKAGAPISRDALMQSLLERGIATRRGIMAIHRELPYRDAPLVDGPRWEQRLPETAAAADETIILPLFHQMTEEEQDYVIECIHHIGARARG